jgi:uncharacterized phiE125 gp8 family phage protein
MSWTVETVDRTSLATALLPLVKGHCRVDFDDDDTLITTYTKIAIGQLEQVWGFTVFGVEGIWKPVALTNADAAMAELDRRATPVQPVSDFEAIDDDGNDITADFQLINATSISTPTYLATKDGSPFPDGTIVSLSGGFEDADDMPPEALGAVLQVTARLYEYRESSVSFSINQMPMWLNDLLVGLWQPRA